MKILVPVRYPLTEDSRSTIDCALELKEKEEAENDAESVKLVVLHVDLFQESGEVSREELRREVESEFAVGDVSYVVRRGFLVEETILDEAANQGVDVIVIGKTRSGKLRRTLRRLVRNDPDIESYLRKNLDVRLEVAD